MSDLRRELAWMLVTLFPLTACGQEVPEAIHPESKLPLILSETFEAGGLKRFAASNPLSFKIDGTSENHYLAQYRHIENPTPVRSPFNRAILNDVVVGNFQMDVQLQSTARDYPHRSLVLFFGYQDPAHMYYVHFGQRADDHANQIFIVNEAPRTKISTKSTEGTPWDNSWHHARIKRDVSTGSIEIYFDDMHTPVMTASDKTFLQGKIGVGSFDDTGNFDNLWLFGERVDTATP